MRPSKDQWRGLGVWASSIVALIPEVKWLRVVSLCCLAVLTLLHLKAEGEL